MRILSAEAKNFGSYESLSFDFDNQGLTLISGPTGSGKSTLMDIVAWGLFGITAKGGAVDEVKSWTGTGPTTVTLRVDDLTITRIRGKSNDLYYECQGVIFRGKDLADTQKRLNDVLGLTAEGYLASAYFHEFSPTSAFFTTTAKVRRLITEQLVDLSMPKELSEKLGTYRKYLKDERERLIKDAALYKERCDSTNASIFMAERAATTWDERRADKLMELSVKRDNFEADQQRVISAINAEHIKQVITLQTDIQDIEKSHVPDDYYDKQRDAFNIQIEALGQIRCETCGALKNQERRMALTKSLYDLDREVEANNQRRVQLKRLNQQLDRAVIQQQGRVAAEESRVNTYAEQIKDLQAEANPHRPGLETYYEQLKQHNALRDANTTELENVIEELEDSITLSDVLDEFRGALIRRAVSFIETETNRLLTDHFEAQLRVEFEVADADKLEVTICKDGNICTYSQLSKGQRQLLKLCFGVAVMKCAGNHSGSRPSCIMFDEPGDGCDEALKLKSFGLLEQLSTEYESVLVIDHNDAFKSMFTKRYDVTLNNGKSQITEG